MVRVGSCNVGSTTGKVREIAECMNRRMVDILCDCVWNVLSAYAPQAGHSEAVKEEFMTEWEGMIANVPESEKLIVAGDMNAHIGKEVDGWDGVHGGFGFSEKNREGERLLESAHALNLSVLNTYFQKRELNRVITYKSGNASSVIDFMFVRKSDCKYV
ncbi:Craniofacial development protein 2 [Nymphon striatum]|nr:Craniofacial development protein 2 [Nymphon striatum]